MIVNHRPAPDYATGETLDVIETREAKALLAEARSLDPSPLCVPRLLDTVEALIRAVEALSSRP